MYPLQIRSSPVRSGNLDQIQILFYDVGVITQTSCLRTQIKNSQKIQVLSFSKQRLRYLTIMLIKINMLGLNIFCHKIFRIGFFIPFRISLLKIAFVKGAFFGGQMFYWYVNLFDQDGVQRGAAIRSLRAHCLRFYWHRLRLR